MGADDFMQRVEMALYAFGFNGDNSIAMVNLCRDEVTVALKQRIEHVFGSSFSTNGLGGVLTCGVTGIGAGLSHSPLCGTTGKERYVFFSFPHISINASGEVGPMSRPGRPGQSCACGALIKSWNELRAEGLTCNCKIPGVHAALDPEYSILKQRIARRLRHEGATDESVKSLNLTDVTKVAERTISDDLEFLISQAVDPKKADYAVITGVQIHNWANSFEDDSPNLEFVAPTAAYVVVNGVKTHVDLSAVPVRARGVAEVAAADELKQIREKLEEKYQAATVSSAALRTCGACPQRAGSRSRAAVAQAPLRRAVAARAEAKSLSVKGDAEVIEASGQQIIVRSDGTLVITPGNGTHPSWSGEPPRATAETEYLTARVNKVQEQFGNALGADDFIQRVEMALYAFGFNGDNSIAMVNLCRDEVTVTLKQRIEHVFGSSFSTNGLGGVLTCGVTGIGAGLSHSPLCESGKERYVFFSFPHISINASGEVGPMSRPGRPGQSCACGALIKSWNEIRSEGLTCNCKIPGVHDALDPEYSILKQRIARRLRHEGATDESVKGLNLTDVTKVAERTISDDLEFLISQAVDPKKADYAVITGVQIHNWANNFEDDSPNLEFVAPTAAYVVVNGVKTHIDLTAVPPLTPRQTRLLNGTPELSANQGGAGVLMEESPDFAYDSKDARRAQRERLQNYVRILKADNLEGVASTTSPTWQKSIATSAPARQESDNSTFIDQKFASAAADELKQIREKLEEKYQAVRP
ncbi:hypothetical protein COHA_007383 [Chlorella ohadii]|uniref:Limiting CO2-inducible protein B/C beta carbonyic anhydrase domain-containing protein n=1 Tax=Chlorella ohadii TaxID=2649997 RepID=A0AAD5DNB4_9CHLO|nr:hypothetical protein COHA_007383 [Chlorella ohadii]